MIFHAYTFLPQSACVRSYHVTCIFRPLIPYGLGGRTGGNGCRNAPPATLATSSANFVGHSESVKKSGFWFWQR